MMRPIQLILSAVSRSVNGLSGAGRCCGRVAALGILVVVFMVVLTGTAGANWLGITSGNYVEHCGETDDYTIQAGLDGTSQWRHYVDE
ncbi:MAG: hypothetical protein GY850_11000, partial [bacterium]|nr:hypothetical protein [bacterium]